MNYGGLENTERVGPIICCSAGAEGLFRETQAVLGFSTIVLMALPHPTSMQATMITPRSLCNWLL